MQKIKRTDVITYASDVMTLMHNYLAKYEQKMLAKNKKKYHMILCRLA